MAWAVGRTDISILPLHRINAPEPCRSGARAANSTPSPYKFGAMLGRNGNSLFSPVAGVSCQTRSGPGLCAVSRRLRRAAKALACAPMRLISFLPALLFYTLFLAGCTTAASILPDAVTPERIDPRERPPVLFSTCKTRAKRRAA